MTADIRAGTRIGQYEVISVLGTGTSADTFLAAGPDGRNVVGKRLTGALARDDAIRARFLSANDASARIRMRIHVTAVVGQRSTGEGVFLFREYVEGRSLSAIAALQCLRELDAERVAFDLCEALRGLDRAKVVHGGIHPGNIIIQPDGRVKLTDYGTSRAALCMRAEDPYPLEALCFLAPEQLQGKAPALAGDIYALGLIIALVERGKAPIAGADAKSVRSAILAGIRESCPAMAAALALNPSKRYANVESFAERLRKRKEQEPERDSKNGTEEVSQEERENETETLRPVVPGRMGAIRDIKKGVDLYDGSCDNVIRVARGGVRRQHPLHMVNVGKGPLEVSAECRGKGIRVSPARVVLPEGQLASMIVNLDANSDSDARVAFKWQEPAGSKTFELLFQAKDG